MGRIQNMRMDRAKRAFKEEMFPSDKSRSFYVDHVGNVIGFAMERADGNVLFYNAETGHYKSNQQNFEIRPGDGAVNLVPYEYQNGQIVDVLSEKPYEAGKHNACFYARYFCGEFDKVITGEEYNQLRETGKLYESDTLDYDPIFDGKIYPTSAESAHAQISLFGYYYDDDRRTVPSKAEMAAAGVDFTMNTKIGYLYRDADNYKVWNECVIEGTLTQEQKQKILDSRFDGEWFIPHLVGLPEQQFEEWDDQSDHPYFELYEDSFKETALAPTVKVKAADLVNAFERCNQTDWSEPAYKQTLDDMITSASSRMKQQARQDMNELDKNISFSDPER